MRMLLTAIALALLAVALGPRPVSAFEVEWADQFGETTYTLSGPDVVLVGETATVTVTASDPLYPNVMVASPWSISDNASILDDGFALWLDGAGEWSSSYSLTYEEVGTHEILFAAQDLGHGGGAHNWEWFELTGIVDVQGAVAVEQVSWGGVKQLYR